MTPMELARSMVAREAGTGAAPAAPARPRGPPGTPDEGELYAWFEDTSGRRAEGRRGIAGLPESLLPHVHGMRVVDRQYCPGHLHLLSAVRIRLRHGLRGELAAIHSAALAIGTVAWVGVGPQYEAAWRRLAV